MCSNAPRREALATPWMLGANWGSASKRGLGEAAFTALDAPYRTDAALNRPNRLSPRGGPIKQRIRFCSAADGVRIALARAGKGRHWRAARTGSPISGSTGRERCGVTGSKPRCGGHAQTRYVPWGSGLPDRAVDDRSLDAWVRDLETVVDALGLRPFPLIGLCEVTLSPTLSRVGWATCCPRVLTEPHRSAIEKPV